MNDSLQFFVYTCIISPASEVFALSVEVETSNEEIPFKHNVLPKNIVRLLNNYLERDFGILNSLFLLS
jgi:hypothetical protein